MTVVNGWFLSLLSSSQDRDVRLSKSMSYALRHGANHMGLHMGAGEHPVATPTMNLNTLLPPRQFYLMT